MINQAPIGLDSREEANPFNKDGFLPIFCSPMYSIIDQDNYKFFLEKGIRVCMPRKVYGDETVDYIDKEAYFEAVSLKDFCNDFLDTSEGMVVNADGSYKKTTVLIDTANGGMNKLHASIKLAKEIYGDKLVIMAGNVSSVEAFIQLAKTGVDYIRCGVGGGLSCNTTSNTGVGQEDLGKLIEQCYKQRQEFSLVNTGGVILDMKNGDMSSIDPFQDVLVKNVKDVKIVADGISSYIKLCQNKYGFNDNGYAAINKLLQCADMVMVGSLFAQCLDSAGEKGFEHYGTGEIEDLSSSSSSARDWFDENNLYVKMAGMSTVEEQKKYRDKVTIEQIPSYRPSEGSVKWIPVRWTLNEWLNGSDNQDQPPYLMGWVNSIKSAMSYVGAKTLKEFKI